MMENVIIDIFMSIVLRVIPTHIKYLSKIKLIEQNIKHT